jgi:hypothetical protein
MCPDASRICPDTSALMLAACVVIRVLYLSMLILVLYLCAHTSFSTSECVLVGLMCMLVMVRYVS